MHGWRMTFYQVYLVSCLGREGKVVYLELTLVKDTGAKK